MFLSQEPPKTNAHQSAPPPHRPPQAPAREAAVSILKAFLSGRRPETVIAYLSDIRDFARYCGREATNEEVEDVLFGDKSSSARATKLVLGYRQNMIDRKLVRHTINRRLAVIRGVAKVARYMQIVPPS